MTKSMTILALTCFLVLGAAATSILARSSIPPAGVAASVGEITAVVSNRDAKQDKLTVTSLALAEAPAEPAPAPVVSEPLRQAYASSSDADIAAARAVAPVVAAEQPAAAPVQPKVKAEAKVEPKVEKVAVHPQSQKYAFLSDAQIAGIKERLHLTSDQEYYWPGIEQALRGIARKVQAARLSNPNANAASIDPDSQEVQQLKSAAMPLLFQLRDDQKEEVRKLARVIGLERVASAI